MNASSEPAVFGWVSAVGTLAIAAGIIWRVTGWDGAGAVMAVLCGGAAVTAMANGWWVGFQPPPATHAQTAHRVSAGLVGTRLATAAGLVTVVDDSTCGERRRRSVIAVDTAGRAGMLFVELDRYGRVTAAALPGGDWATAEAV